MSRHFERVIERSKFCPWITSLQGRFDESVSHMRVLGEQRAVAICRDDVAIAQSLGPVFAIVTKPPHHRTQRASALAQARPTRMVLEPNDHRRALDSIGPEDDVADKARITCLGYMGSAPMNVAVCPS